MTRREQKIADMGLITKSSKRELHHSSTCFNRRSREKGASRGTSCWRNCDIRDNEDQVPVEVSSCLWTCNKQKQVLKKFLPSWWNGDWASWRSEVKREVTENGERKQMGLILREMEEESPIASPSSDAEASREGDRGLQNSKLRMRFQNLKYQEAIAQVEETSEVAEKPRSDFLKGTCINRWERTVEKSEGQFQRRGWARERNHSRKNTIVAWKRLDLEHVSMPSLFKFSRWRILWNWRKNSYHEWRWGSRVASALNKEELRYEARLENAKKTVALSAWSSKIGGLYEKDGQFNEAIRFKLIHRSCSLLGSMELVKQPLKVSPPLRTRRQKESCWLQQILSSTRSSSSKLWQWGRP